MSVVPTPRSRPLTSSGAVLRQHPPVVDPSAPPRSRDRTRVPTTRHSIVRVTWLLASRIRRGKQERRGVPEDGQEGPLGTQAPMVGRSPAPHTKTKWCMGWTNNNNVHAPSEGEATLMFDVGNVGHNKAEATVEKVLGMLLFLF